MSYAIATVIYGVDLTGFPDELDLDWGPLHEEGYDWDESIGIHSEYSGNSDENPCYLGVEIHSFDECNNFLLKDLVKKCEVTSEIIAKWEERKGEMPPVIWAAIEKWIAAHPGAGYSLTPEVHIIWGSS